MNAIGSSAPGPGVPTIAASWLRPVAFSITQQQRGGFARVAVAACNSGDGTTTVTVNLARVLSDEMDRRVALINANPARTVEHQSLIPAAPAAWHDLSSEFAALQNDYEPGDGVAVISGGGRSSPREPLLLAERSEVLRRKCDIVLFDCAPLAEHPQTATLAGSVDGLILVLQSEVSRWDAASRAVEMLHAAHVNILGVVLNNTPRRIPRWLDRLL